MKTIKCNECDTFLFETNKENNGAIGAEAQERGFVYKNACLYSDKYSSLFFCNDLCGHSFYRKNIPRNQEMDKIIEDTRKDIPKMAKEVGEKMSQLIERINKRK